MAYGCGSGSKEKAVGGDPTSYSNFFRMEVDLREFKHVRMSFLRFMNWTKVGVVYHSGRGSSVFSGDQYSLIEALESNGFEVLRSENYVKKSHENIAKLKAADVRIVFLGFSQNYLQVATELGCEAYQQGLAGPKYVWISIGYISYGWWRPLANGTTCTMEELDYVFQNMFYVLQGLRVNEEMTMPGTGKTMSDLRKKLVEKYGILKGYQYIATAYDNVVILAQVLNRSEEYLRSINSSVTLANFHENRYFISSVIADQLRKFHFDGFSGKISFDNITNEVNVESMVLLQDDLYAQRHVVYEMDQSTGEGKLTEYPIQWGTIDNTPPLDGPVIKDKINAISCHLSTVALVLTVLGFSLTFLLFAAVTWRLKNKTFKSTSPRLNLIVLLGSLCLVCSLPLGDAAMNSVFICSCRMILVVTGCCMTLGSLFSRAFRVYFIFTRIQRQIGIMSDVKLIAFTIIWTLLNLTILFVWIIWDGLYIVNVVDMENDVNEDTLVRTTTSKCSSDHDEKFMYTLLALQIGMMGFGCFLAFSTRNVTYKELNDSKSIASTIYIVTLMGIISTVAGMFSKDVNISFGIITFSIFTGTLLVLAKTFSSFINKNIRYSTSKLESKRRFRFRTDLMSRVAALPMIFTTRIHHH